MRLLTAETNRVGKIDSSGDTGLPIIKIPTTLDREHSQLKLNTGLGVNFQSPLIKYTITYYITTLSNLMTSFVSIY